MSKVNPKDGLTYVGIRGGEYTFGCATADDKCFSWEKRPERVSVNDFWIGQTEVTQEAYEKVLGTNPSRYKGQRRPVDSVSWSDARQYCEAVGMRLPTEREWEYAARAGTPSGTYGQIDEIAWFDGNSEDKTHKTAKKLPNGYGLYDMLGNVWEWVQDLYEVETGKRILRGGSFFNAARELRFSNRLWATPDTAHRNMGVRCVEGI